MGNEPAYAIRRGERSPFLGCDVDSSVPLGSIALEQCSYG
jgi:hypothetical protein